MSGHVEECTDISICLPDLRGGGAERVCINLANEFVERGLKVDMVLMRNEGELASSLDRRVRVIDLDAPRPRHVLGPLVRYLRQARPEAVLANMWPLTILAVLARSLSRVRCRLVAVEHTTWSVADLAKRPRTRRFIKVTMNRLLPRADAVVGVSGGVSRDLEKFAGLKQESVSTVFNPVTDLGGNSEGGLPDSLDIWASGSHKRLLAVGTLKIQKDFPTLLEALALLPTNVPAHLLILGEGSERPRIEAHIQKLGLQEKVTLPGFVGDVSPVYKLADLFVLSSVSEGLPTVLIEALEQGTPVVSTDCRSGPREILEDGKYGTLVPVGDVEALAKAMDGALSLEHDREALKRRAQDFSVDKAADAYLDLLLPGWRNGAAE